MAASNAIRPLECALGDQDGRFALAYGLVADACRPESHSHAFPGAVVAITNRGRLVGLEAFGRFTYEDSPAVSPQTVFDLASVTKVIATTTMAMILHERGLLSLDASVCELMPEFDVGDVARRRVTVRMLLTHSSGLPAYIKLFKTAQSRAEMVRIAAATPLEVAPQQRATYSDLGFIILGDILERIAREPIDSFCQREVFAPLGMLSATFHPDERLRIPPTQSDCEVRHRVVQGEVNDENAAVMGGVAGHAGLFANAMDVARFAECMLRGGAPILRHETIDLFCARDSRTAGSTRALGWDTPSQPSQSGRYFGANSFGHLGFTGTSVWCDPDRQCSITLLTNRTWPDRANQQIRHVRPVIHDAIMEAIAADDVSGA